MILRPYQIEAVEAARAMARAGHKRILLSLSTGSGKSLCIAEMCRKSPGRVLVLCHQAEILKQNQLALKMLSGEDAGIFCAGLGEKDLSRRVTFAHRDSLGNDSVLSGLAKFPLVIVDECFVAGTLVDGIPIEKILPGQYVTSFNEEAKRLELKKVLAVSKTKKPGVMYKVTVNGKTLVCTANHPFFTKRGWVVASQISNFDQVLSIKDGMQRMQKRSSKGTNACLAKNVNSQKWLLLLFSRVQKHWSSKILQKNRFRIFSKNETKKSNDKQRYFRKDESYFKSNWTQAPSARRKWETYAYSCSNYFRRISRTRFYIGMRRENILQNWKRLSRLIQNRYWRTKFKDRHRVRWKFSQLSKSKIKGQQKRQITYWAWVDNIEIQKQDNTTKQNGSGECNFVYNLQVAKNENYFVGGVLVHNCHLISSRESSRYQRIFDAAHPDYTVGFTATPYRLSGGKIYGRGKFFEVCAYHMTIGKLVAQGYLSKYVFDGSDAVFNTDGVTVSGTEFNVSELSEKASQEKDLDRSAEIIINKTKDRNLTLIFCVGRAHAREIQNRIPGCAYLDGDTEQKSRDELLERMRQGDVKHVVNVGVLTTGVDVPRIDCIAMLRPTMSASLYIQCLGRGLRLHPDKKDLLILELTDNFERFGSLDDPMLFGSQTEQEILPSLGINEPPKKSCPECKQESPNGVRVCPFCDYLFLRKREDYGNGEILTLNVSHVSYAPTVTRLGNDAFIATFKTELGVFKEWLNITNPNQFVQKTAISKLRKLKEGKISIIKVRGIHEKFPRILSYHSDL